MHHKHKLLIIGIALTAFVSTGLAKEKVVPNYTSDNELILPEGFEEWIFVGANIGLAYSREVEAMTELESARNAGDQQGPGVFHNIYINPSSYKAYKKTGKFPEKTMLVMDVYEAHGKEPKGIVNKGFYEKKRTDIEVAVKNSDRPGQTPESKGEWAYYVFGKDGKTAAAFPDKSCFDCHTLHAQDDHVWVQFYPILQRSE